jgi:hypothetical protein
MLANLADGTACWKLLMGRCLTFENIDFSSHSRSWGTERSRKNLALSATPAMLKMPSLRAVEAAFAYVPTKAEADVRRSFSRGC